MIKKLTVIGTGLIGGSLIRALRDVDAVEHVTGCARKTKTLDTALKLGIIDSGETNPAKAVIDADIVVIATPVGSIKSILSLISDSLKPGAIVSDVGSVKEAVVNDVIELYGVMPDWFIPAHPVAGTEKSGIEASFHTLFNKCQVVLTPVEETDPNKLAVIEKMWQKTGAIVSTMTVEDHDEILAATSHLPHVIAYSLVNQLTNMDKSDLVFKLAAGGFKDLTRIASSDPTMWRDICLGNRSKILDLIKSYKENLSTIESYIENNDEDKLFSLFKSAKSSRDINFE